ncbi:hypothetical protein EPA93_10235 [Ktedonosporobacter rubrisoli]|uniref:Uncharacterized protein n=1 Tax=Ktedonosporobacter rubrisoli TaxID=2509675 RepID=A0A4P6JNP7_KTERU|nr:hypothetical protein [Ktedonosporobacter rubrisoli]QBD76366.1 hypothetical protein EPA93_10235 [Ktedonosporobacter rubrisoli]
MLALYHQYPLDMRGEVLYPLNTLKYLYPDIYEREILKYQDHPNREDLPKRVIPLLNCLWNDVVQCSPIHPHLVYLALRERGFPVQPDRAFWQIPLSALADVPIAVVGYPRNPLGQEHAHWLDRSTYCELDAVPAETLAWYDYLAQQKKLVGIFQGIPHVMVQGPISVLHARKIHWGELPM